MSAPVALDIAALQVHAVPIVAVGLEPNGEMEILEVDEVGWYRYRPHPGYLGTAVLGGDPPRWFVVDEIARVPKTELPQEVWARIGPRAWH